MLRRIAREGALILLVFGWASIIAWAWYRAAPLPLKSTSLTLAEFLMNSPPPGSLLIRPSAGVAQEAFLQRLRGVKEADGQQRCVFVGVPSTWRAMIERAEEERMGWLGPVAFVATEEAAAVLVGGGVAYFSVMMHADIGPAEPGPPSSALPFLVTDWEEPVRVASLWPGFEVGPANLRVVTWLGTRPGARAAMVAAPSECAALSAITLPHDIRIVASVRTIGAARLLAATGHLELLVCSST